MSTHPDRNPPPPIRLSPLLNRIVTTFFAVNLSPACD